MHGRAVQVDPILTTGGPLLVPALEAEMRWTAFKICFQFRTCRYGKEQALAKVPGGATAADVACVVGPYHNRSRQQMAHWHTAGTQLALLAQLEPCCPLPR